MHLGMVECLVQFTGHCDLDLWPSFRKIMSRAYLLYYKGRNPKFGGWVQLWMVESHVPFLGHFDLDL